MKQSLLLILVLSSLYFVHNYGCDATEAKASEDACIKGTPKASDSKCCWTSYTNNGVDETYCEEVPPDRLNDLGGKFFQAERKGVKNLKVNCGGNLCGEGDSNKSKSNCMNSKPFTNKDSKCCYGTWTGTDDTSGAFCAVFGKNEMNNLEQVTKDTIKKLSLKTFVPDCGSEGTTGSGSGSDGASSASYVRAFFLGLFLFLF